jgi:3-oxoacyl-[acyl-carrier-protein] synthase-3
MRSKIIGLGSYLPEKIITNDDLSQKLDTSDEWISTRTGIKERRIANKDESTSAMGFYAAQKALAAACLQASDLDLILVATSTPDFRLPSTAVIIQDLLGAHNIPALDISAACAGSIYGLSIANSFIKAGIYKNILLVTSESMSAIVNWEDRNTAILFGDGASAAILSTSSDQSGFIDISLYADGAQQKTIWIPAGGSKKPTDAQALINHEDKVLMNGRETFKFAVRALCEAVEKLLHKHNLSAADISFAVPHQANLRIIEAIAKRLDMPMDRFLINLDRCANTSAASLLLAYDEASQAHRLKKDDLVLMLAIGAGMVWGAGLYRV